MTLGFFYSQTDISESCQEAVELLRVPLRCGTSDDNIVQVGADSGQPCQRCLYASLTYGCYHRHFKEEAIDPIKPLDSVDHEDIRSALCNPQLLIGLGKVQR